MIIISILNSSPLPGARDYIDFPGVLIGVGEGNQLEFSLHLTGLNSNARAGVRIGISSQMDGKLLPCEVDRSIYILGGFNIPSFSFVSREREIRTIYIPLPSFIAY